jgi:hypothetical protein
MIGVFVWFAGSRELFTVRMRHAPSRAGVFRNIYQIFQTWSEAAARNQAARRERPPAGEERGRHAQDPSGPATTPDGEWSDERIAELERFRGPLRHFPEAP